MAEKLILSIKKALDIIEILVFADFEHKGISLTELANRLNQRTNTMHTILKTMRACGFADQNSEGKYIAGAKCIAIGEINSIAPRGPLFNSAQKIISELSEKTGEAFVFAVLVNGIRLVVIRSETTGAIRVNPEAFERRSLLSNATGRVLAAFSNINSKTLQKSTADECCDSEIIRILGQIRETGYYTSVTAGGDIAEMAVPVNITPLAALGCYIPIFRHNSNRSGEIIDLMKKAAKNIEMNVNLIPPH